MPQDKKSKVDEIIILRKILDNPSDPRMKQLLPQNEKALNSIYRQLTGSNSTLIQKPSRFIYQFDTLEPKVTIHTKFHESRPQVSTSVSFQLAPTQPTSLPLMTQLPEFELVSTPSIMKTPLLNQVVFSAEELYEVEKIEPSFSEFPEAIPPEAPENQPETMMHNDEPKIPEWQPVEETLVKETQEKPTDKGVEFQQVDTDTDSESDTSAGENIPEFERIEASTQTITEKPDEWETGSPAEQHQVQSPEIHLAEPSVTPIQKLTRKQIRDERKAEKRKEKEAKKQKKLELKKLKMETYKKEQEAQQPAEEEQSFQTIPEAQPVQTELISEEKPQPMKSLNTAFNGMETINEHTAELLYKNGYFSIENLNDATLDDLVQIRGIRRKLAKQIKNEARQKITISSESEFIPIKGKTRKQQLKETSDDFANWESNNNDENSEPSLPPNTCVYNKYILYKKTTKKDGKTKTTIHFFSKEKPQVGHPAPLPRGYRIAVNKKTGVPYLKKKE